MNLISGGNAERIQPSIADFVNIVPNGKNIYGDMLYACIKKNLMSKTICDSI